MDSVSVAGAWLADAWDGSLLSRALRPLCLFHVQTSLFTSASFKTVLSSVVFHTWEPVLHGHLGCEQADRREGARSLRDGG